MVKKDANGRDGPAGADAESRNGLCERCARACKQSAACVVVSCPKWQKRE